MMEPAEYRSVFNLLYLKSCTQKEAFVEIKEVYGEDAPS